MVRNAIAPNIRTVNTLLEACVKNGDMHSAQQLFATLSKALAFISFLPVLMTHALMLICLCLICRGRAWGGICTGPHP